MEIYVCHILNTLNINSLPEDLIPRTIGIFQMLFRYHNSLRGRLATASSKSSLLNSNESIIEYDTGSVKSEGSRPDFETKKVTHILN